MLVIFFKLSDDKDRNKIRFLPVVAHAKKYTAL